MPRRTRLICWHERAGESTRVLLYAGQEIIHEDAPALFEDDSRQRMVYIRDAGLPVQIVQELGVIDGQMMTAVVEPAMIVRV